MIDDIVADKKCTSLIENNLFDPWVGTPLQGYKFLGNKIKGKYGERVVEMYFKSKNIDVRKAENAGHDRIIANIKTEIKFSAAQTDNKNKVILSNVFMMNHVSTNKDWDRLVFLGYNPKDYDHVFFWFTKEKFKTILTETSFFSVQQGGGKGGNDDYMCGDAQLIQLSKSQYVNRIGKW